MDDRIEVGVGVIWVDDQEIVHMDFNPSVTIHEQDARDLFQARRSLRPGRLQRLLVDLRTNPRPDQAARAFVKRPEVTAITGAMAMIAPGMVSRVLGNFFLGLNRGEFPTRLFATEDEAKTWLLDQAIAGAD